MVSGFAELAGKLVPKIGEVFEGAGSSLLRGLKNWWHGPLLKSKEIQYILKTPQALDEIVADIPRLRSEGAGLLKGLNSTLSSANAEIFDTLRQTKELVNSGIASEAAKAANKSLERFAGVLKSGLGETGALQYLEENPELENTLSGLLTKWKQSVFHSLQTMEQINRAASRNLADDSKFVQEYLQQILPNKDSQIGKLWLSNPENANKLETLALSGSKKLRALLTAASTARETLPEASSIPKYFKLAGGAAALGTTGLGLVKLFRWFHSTGQQEEADILKDLDALGATGEALPIVQATKSALQTLNTVRNPDLSGSDAAQQAQATIASMGASLDALANSYSQWNIVLRNSANKNLAKQAGDELGHFLQESRAALESVEKSL